MSILEIMRLNLLSPMVLAFILGIIAVRVKSDLRIPSQIYDIISIYLLFAIGLKGGFDLAESSLTNFGTTALVTALLGAGIPLWTFWILRYMGRMDAENAIALGIHYGAVSAVTLSAAVTFLTEANEPFEGFMPTMYVIMEIPAVIVGLVLAQRLIGEVKQSPDVVIRSALSSKSFLLLGGGVVGLREKLLKPTRLFGLQLQEVPNAVFAHSDPFFLEEAGGFQILAMRH
ncbi:MAG: sodium-dependent bicarbonate transport family permease, partial [Anaerolineae bacterium]|nr:sodium-dependent bicarbonate transport family permease [Anaerolineae bacterium]